MEGGAETGGRERLQGGKRALKKKWEIKDGGNNAMNPEKKSGLDEKVGRSEGERLEGDIQEQRGLLKIPL